MAFGCLTGWRDYIYLSIYLSIYLYISLYISIKTHKMLKQKTMFFKWTVQNNYMLLICTHTHLCMHACVQKKKKKKQQLCNHTDKTFCNFFFLLFFIFRNRQLIYRKTMKKIKDLALGCCQVGGWRDQNKTKLHFFFLQKSYALLIWYLT